MSSSATVRRRAPIVPAVVTARNLRLREATQRRAHRSPNRERLVARAAVWVIAVGGAAAWIPHVVS
ncbi:MAG: hypothetical protein ACJ798_06955 [Phenylobacterium sp.]